MSVLTADFNEALVTAWNASTLNTIFKAYWSSANQSEFVVLHDKEASPAQPFPYVIFEIGTPNTVNRMSSGDADHRRETRSIPVTFKVYSREIPASGKSAKVLAKDLVEEVVKIFGGHPVTAPTSLTLTHGEVLQSTYKDDFSARLDDQIFQWDVNYEFLVDVPVADS